MSIGTNTMLKLLTFKNHLISESSLTIQDLEKPTPDVKFKDRGSLLVHKINKRIAFELSKGGSVVLKFLDKTAEHAATSQDYKNLKKDCFVDGKGNKYKLSDLKKTAEFGSNKGSGGGAAATSVNESAQALYCSLVFNIFKAAAPAKKITKQQLEQAYKFISVTTPLDEMCAITDPAWIETFVGTANALYSKYKASGVRFHRGSPFTEKIKSAFNSTKLKTNINKWNPADIWLTTAKGESIPFANNIDALNAQIFDAYNSKDLIGISLKKIGKNPVIEVYNDGDRPKPKKYSGYSFAHAAKNKFFGSIDSYIWVGTDTKIQFRAFSVTSGWQGEIKSTAANYGKVSHGPVNEILKRVLNKSLSPQQDVTRDSKTHNDAFVHKMYALYCKRPVEGAMDYKTFVSKVNATTNPASFRFSKMLCMEFIDILEGASTSQKDKIVSEILGYASSNLSTSSVFVKVH